jgi:channel protein (hemolysin III family)
MGREPDLYHLTCMYEPFSAISHLLGAIVFVFLGLRLLQRGRGDRSRLMFLGVFAGGCVVMLIISGLYHIPARGTGPHRILERIDHATIFVFIAATFTPTHGLLFDGWLRWGPLSAIWGVTLLAVTLKTLFFDYLPESIGFSFYLTLGWSGGITMFLLGRRYGFAFIRPLLIGGVIYSIGGVVEFFQTAVLVPGYIHSHETLHITVLVGAYCHWLFMWQFAAGEPGPRSSEEFMLEPVAVPENSNI